ncbi:DUF2206 domain-containing protein, partial [Candidatus Bathyarchaeota archaeon]|nr:DUF2206 domain-containing protein [Candidatus Bathyarchaeota archaeon]
MLQLARQQIAELFLVLMLLAVVTEGLKGIYKSLFLVIFGISLVMSHYGTAYLFMLILIAYFAALLIARSQIFRFYRQSSFINLNSSTLRLPFIALYVATTLAWYMYIAGSHPFITLIHSARIIFEEFINPYYSDAFQLIIRGAVSPLHNVTKMLYHVTQLLTVIGILDL